MTIPFFTNPTANIWKNLLPKTEKSARKWEIFYLPVEKSADAPYLRDNLSKSSRTSEFCKILDPGFPLETIIM